MTIALVGLHGTLGKPFLEALTSKEFFGKQIIAVARDVSQYKDTDKVKYAKFDDLDKVVQEATVLISVAGPPAAYAGILDALKKPNSVKLYIPCTYGLDSSAMESWLPMHEWRTKHIEETRALGIKTVLVACGLFFVPNSFLYEKGLGLAGLNPDAKTVQYIGDPDQEFNISNIYDLGKSVASLVTRVDSSDIPDTVRVFSDITTPKKVVDLWIKNHGPVEIKELEPRSVEDATKDAQNRLKNGFKFQDFLFYLQVVIANGVDKGALFGTDNDELVNPSSGLWKWHKYI